VSLTSLAFRSIRKNFRNYFIYFVSMILSMVIYYTFVAIKYHSKLQSATDS